MFTEMVTVKEAETHDIFGDKGREEAEEIRAREITSKEETERGLDRCARWGKWGDGEIIDLEKER